MILDLIPMKQKSKIARNYDHISYLNATYKNIFFDLDRTIWDFDKNSAEALAEIVQKFDLGSKVPELSEFISTYNFYNDRLWDFYRKGKIKKYLLCLFCFLYSRPLFFRTVI